MSRTSAKSAKGTSASPERLLQHWRALCVRIGERRAGSAGESAAAEYLQREFSEMSLANVHAEPFPCVSLRKASVELSIGEEKNLQPVEARALAGAPATKGTVEANLVWVEMPEQAERLLTRSAKGKIVVLIGPLPTHVDLHKRLVASKPAAVIHVDDRLPFDWVKDDGVYPTWARRYGMPPTVALPFMKAWELRKSGANRARIRIEVKQDIGESQNVAAEIPGKNPSLPIILLGAHHDTQCNNPGADDNASGVVGVLELAELLRETKPLRTIRIVSFGTEEQLSVGSAQYVIAHRKELSKIGVVLNIDSVSSVIGHQMLVRAGTDEFGAWMMKELSRVGFDAQEKTAAMPFADHFPFSVFGVPAVTFHKGNINGGMRWQHHSALDNLDNVSVSEMARVVNAMTAVTAQLANEPHWKFKRGLAKEQEKETMRLARDLYDLGIR